MSEDKSLEDFMNSFMDDGPTEEIDQEYFEIESRYYKLFGHGVPQEMLPDSITMDQIKEAMKSCIAHNTDNLFQLLGVTIHDDYLY